MFILLVLHLFELHDSTHVLVSFFDLDQLLKSIYINFPGLASSPDIGKIKNNLKRQVKFWEVDLTANKLILDTINNGYILPFGSLPSIFHSEKNNPSSLENKQFDEETIQ